MAKLIQTKEFTGGTNRYCNSKDVSNKVDDKINKWLRDNNKYAKYVDTKYSTTGDNISKVLLIYEVIE
jgi:hypothetical protein